MVDRVKLIRSIAKMMNGTPEGIIAVLALLFYCFIILNSLLMMMALDALLIGE